MAYISFQPSDYFNTKLYTGTGATNAQTGIGFQPDWVWIQNRGGTYANVFFDAPRGVTKLIEPQGTGAQATVADSLTSFDSDGFTLGADSSNYCNKSSNTYAAWNWRAGGGAGSSNTDGSINTTTTSVDTTAGISLSTYSGTGSAATIGHGLGVVPQLIIVKNTYQSEDWIVYHHKIDDASSGGGGAPEDKYLNLNDTGSRADNTFWNDTAPTNQVFSVGTSTSVNQAGGTFLAYCFAEKKGFSKFGSYEGNGNNDGPFCYTGFSPAYIIIKVYNGTTGGWYIFDNKRPGYNADASRMLANDGSTADAGTGYIDITSTGFKLRHNADDYNGANMNYAFIAFAAEPVVSSNNVPATAK